jgi:D-alanyl-D-alanine carboxypeptidase/D-alanyl-D-alanine-endopeptidase (penicillin-binding protein 4)
MKALALALALAASLPAATLTQRIEQLIALSPTAHTAFWGIEIVDLANGKTLCEHNADHFFVPASNAKLFTTAMALTRLGPDFTFQTRVMAGQPVDSDGRILGSLRLVGGGDPNLSARTIPYKPGPTIGNQLVALEELADQIVARGVKRVDGDIVGDDTWYAWQPYAIGWSVDDPRSDDGAPISALTVNDNVFTLNVQPGGSPGDLAALALNPPVEYYTIDNRVRTLAASGERHIHIERVPGSLDLHVWGTIPLHDKGQDLLLGIEDPALYAAKALKLLLEQRGITVTGTAVARHLYPHELASLTQSLEPAPDTGAPRSVLAATRMVGTQSPEPAPDTGAVGGAVPGRLQRETQPPDTATELARHTSAPLVEDLRITDKVSQNLHAEMALRAVGRARRNVGSFEAGREEMRTFLGEVGVEGGGYNLVDGSGLSRLDLVTPSAVVKLLQFMYTSKARENWISMLPVGGQDGTLATRFTEGPAARRIHAKTGSLSHVSALSGYAQRPNGRWVAFSILVNNYNGAASDIRAVMDRICTLIME